MADHGGKSDHPFRLSRRPKGDVGEGVKSRRVEWTYGTFFFFFFITSPSYKQSSFHASSSRKIGEQNKGKQ